MVYGIWYILIHVTGHENDVHAVPTTLCSPKGVWEKGYYNILMLSAPSLRYAEEDTRGATT